ncbi:hypothetical protein SDC9_205511 [bioreactor metagenome]|uniref:Uncharacterized protein n=1 Tax=bioreactor metagenome TaxID=1076179 RepID=A0A645J337_9ZZZZ
MNRYSGIVIIAVYLHSPKLAAQGAVSLPVDQVSIPADGLPDHKGKRDDIDKRKKLEAGFSAIDQSGQKCCDNPPVYGQTPFPDLYGIQKAIISRNIE